MAKTSHDGMAVARDAAKCAAFNLETIIVLIEKQDTLAVSGASLAALLRPVLGDMFVAYDELAAAGRAS